MKKLLLIVNPNAGRNGFRNCLSDVLYNLHIGGFETTVAFTNAHGDATRFAAERGGDYDRIVCMGGDGTLNETVSGLMRAQVRPELGYIPMGTTNDSATTLGLSHDPIAAARTAAFGRPLAVDVGRMDERYFFYVAAFGAFTESSYETPQDQKNALGGLAYLLDAMRRLPNLTHRRCRIEYDGGVLEDDFIFCAVSNSRSIAGLIHLDESVGMSLSDGVFEMFLIKTPDNILQLGPIVSNILSSNYTGDNPSVILLQSRTVRFIFDEPTAWTIDGEGGGKHTEVVCENIPRAVSVIVNE